VLSKATNVVPSTSEQKATGMEAPLSTIASGVMKNPPNHSIKRERPTPLKMISFTDSVFDVPGTPKTPRTSTTPGTTLAHIKMRNICRFYFVRLFILLCYISFRIEIY